jgi:hypothetical protein
MVSGRLDFEDGAFAEQAEAVHAAGTEIGFALRALEAPVGRGHRPVAFPAILFSHGIDSSY